MTIGDESAPMWDVAAKTTASIGSARRNATVFIYTSEVIAKPLFREVDGASRKAC